MKILFTCMLTAMSISFFSCNKNNIKLLNEKEGTYQMVLSREYYYCGTTNFIKAEYDTFVIHFNLDHTGYAYGSVDSNTFTWKYRSTKKNVNPSEWIIELGTLHLTNSNNSLERFDKFFVMDFDDDSEQWFWPGDCWFALGSNPTFANRVVYLTKM